MLPTPGTRSVKFEMTMKMKNVVANGNTQRVTRLSKMSPIRPSQPSTSASMTFCSPDDTSLMFFQVETRTTTKIRAATINVQIIEWLTGNPNTLKITSAAEKTIFFAAPPGAGAAGVETALAPAGPATRVCDAGCAFKLTAK